MNLKRLMGKRIKDSENYTYVAKNGDTFVFTENARGRFEATYVVSDIEHEGDIVDDKKMLRRMGASIDNVEWSGREFESAYITFHTNDIESFMNIVSEYCVYENNLDSVADYIVSGETKERVLVKKEGGYLDWESKKKSSGQGIENYFDKPDGYIPPKIPDEEKSVLDELQKEPRYHQGQITEYTLKRYFKWVSYEIRGYYVVQLQCNRFALYNSIKNEFVSDYMFDSAQNFGQWKCKNSAIVRTGNWRTKDARMNVLTKDGTFFFKGWKKYVGEWLWGGDHDDFLAVDDIDENGEEISYIVNEKDGAILYILDKATDKYKRVR